jgi:hypothetical protein
MNGGPSHVDLFDHKPELNKRSGETSPIGGFIGFFRTVLGAFITRE